jgi:nicotinate-nucleotide pyrophosphorylase (carboxylating)
MLSHSEKRAVLLGGCLTHRLDLSDGILVKDNHIAAIMKQARVKKEGAIEIAVGCFGRSEFVEVEVSSVSEALAAAAAGADAILADNVSPAKLRKIAAAVRRADPKIIIEASGGITLENAGAYLKAGADFASTSGLTMKISPANLSLEIDGC